MMYLGKDPIGLATSIPVFSNLAKIEVGEYTPTQDEAPENVLIPHSLGEMPDFILYFSDAIESLSTDQYAYLHNGMIMKSGVIASGVSGDSVFTIYYTKIGANTDQYGRGSVNMSQFLGSSHITTGIRLPYYPNLNQRLKAGVTYHYIIGKFKEVTSNANE